MNRMLKNKFVAEVEEDFGGNKYYLVHLKEGYWFASFETGSKSFNSFKEFSAERIEQRPGA